MDNPEISIIVPCYNVSGAVCDCIRKSRIAFTHEFILVDDGSTDDTLVHIKQLVSEYANIRFLSKPNGGVLAARREGWREAKGEYVVFVDADDYIKLDESIGKWLDAEYDVIKTAGYYVNEGSKEKYSNGHIGEITNSKHAYELLLGGGLLPYMHSAVIRKEAITEVCFDIPRRFAIGEDLLFNVRLFANSRLKMLSIDTPMYYYVQGVASVMHTKIWGFDYLVDFNAILSDTICGVCPELKEKVEQHVFDDLSSCILFPEVGYTSSRYNTLMNMANRNRKLITNAPKRNVQFIENKNLYRLYTNLYRALQRLKGRPLRHVLK